jgi:uncharacterized OB-fold protein
MSFVGSLGTYLPPWGSEHVRAAGNDEDAVTMAIEAGRAALSTGVPVSRVVLVTRDIPLIEGGSSAVLLAGLGLDPDIEVTERLGGAPAALDAIAGARPHTLVVAVDIAPAGAAAALVGESGVAIRPKARLAGSLPVRTRDTGGGVHDYGDPRLLRERGTLKSVRAATTETPRAVAGIDHRTATALCGDSAPRLNTAGASAALFALAWMVETGTHGMLLGVEQASVTGLAVDSGTAPVHRIEPRPRQLPETVLTPGRDIPISLAAYDRAFEAKLGWRASRDPSTGELHFPPRLIVDDRGELLENSELVALPRTGVVYTGVTVRVPVPGLHSPYSLVIVELDDVGVRALVTTTGTEPGSVTIGDRGRVVLRRVAVRSGVPDYGYAFLADSAYEEQEHVA